MEVIDMKYYGWINLKKGGSKYVAVVKITDDFEAYSFNKKTKKWVRNDDNLKVMYDMTSWDEISEKEALDMIRELSNDENVKL